MGKKPENCKNFFATIFYKTITSINVQILIISREFYRVMED